MHKKRAGLGGRGGTGVRVSSRAEDLAPQRRSGKTTGDGNGVRGKRSHRIDASFLGATAGWRPTNMREARKSQLDAPNPFATLNQLTTPFTFTFSSGGFSGGSAWDPAVSSVTDASSVGVFAFSSVAALMASISERPHATHSTVKSVSCPRTLNAPQNKTALVRFSSNITRGPGGDFLRENSPGIITQKLLVYLLVNRFAHRCCAPRAGGDARETPRVRSRSCRRPLGPGELASVSHRSASDALGGHRLARGPGDDGVGSRAGATSSRARRAR